MTVKDLFVVKANGGPEMPGENSLAGFIQQWTQPGKFNQAQLFTLYGGHVYAAAGKVAQSVAKINLRVQQQKSDGDMVEVKSHPFLDLIKAPNPLQSKFTFFEFFQVYALTAGEVFVYLPYGEVTKQPKQMYLLRPDRMTVAIEENTDLPEIKGYVYTAPGGSRIPLDSWELKHFKIPNPENPWRGLGPLEAGLTHVLTAKYGAEFTRNYIYNNAMPAGVLNLKNNISDTEFQKVKKQFRQEYGSVKNAGKTAILRNADAEFVKIGSTLSEIALTELRDLSRDDIFEMFGTPKPVMSITDDVNRANAEAALYHFAINTVDPAMLRISDFFQQILDMFGDSNLSLTYDSPVPRSNDEEIAYNQAAVNNWMTVNEVREKYGLPAIKGGDEIRQPINLVPIDPDEGTPADTDDPNENKGAGKITIRRIVKKKLKKLNFPIEAKENFRLEIMQKQESYEKRFLKVARQFLHKQQNEVIDKLKVEKTKASAGPDYYFDFNADNTEFQQMLQPLMTSLIAEQGALAMKFAGSDSKFEIDQAMRRQIEASINRMSANFNQQTRDALASELIDAIDSGEPIEDITARVEGVYEGATGYRAERIARTETLKGSNYATNEAYQQTGYVIAKEWYCNPDACEFCFDYDGKVVGLETVFSEVGTQVEGRDGGILNLDYESIDVPPLHPNCRCTIIPVTDSTALSSED